jgi:carboxymethylenebutenolidase
MPGKMVEFPAHGRTAPGYLATPSGGGGPGLIVVQEWWGLVDHIRDVADRFAAEGYVVLAPDLYHGDATTSSDEAGHKLVGLDLANVSAELRGAAEYLQAQPGVTGDKVAVVGFCMGGQLALLGGCEHPDLIGPTVSFYGIHPKVTLHVEKLAAPVLAHFAKQDDFTPVATAEALVQRIRDAGKSITVHFYDAQHAFFNDTRPEVHSAEASQLAWTRTLSFLREHAV